MAIGELTVAVDNNNCTTVWYSPYNCSTQYHIVIYGQCPPYHYRSHSYHSSVDHGWPIPSTHPCTIHGDCSYLTRVPYLVAPCRPLWPGPSLTGSGQRGVAQEKWSCGGPRSCLTYGLLLLALPVIWSVCHPSVLGDIIHGLDLDLARYYGFPPSFQGKPLFPSIFWVSSMWNHSDNYRIPYGG